jgi:two-component system NtrC family sensor kinase
MAITRRHSIPGRIFLGFLVVLLSFGGVAAGSLWQHQLTAQTLRLLHEGYLPLSLSVSEARATQGAFATMVERTLEGSETVAAEGWLEIARRVRPFALRRAVDATNQAQKLVRDLRDQATLVRLRAELEAVLLEYELSEEDFEALTGSFAARDQAARAAALTSIRARERSAQLHLTQAWQLISERIASTSRMARDDERRAFGLLVGLGLVALAVSLAITFWSQRVLSPLTKLADRVAAVARGDLSARIERHAPDEIGHVASEFERMVDALSARDEQLRRTERLAAVGRLAAHVTHEVRNPLNSIRLNVELLEEDLAEASLESKRVVSSILREVDRLTDITEQYLRLVRLPEPRRESVELLPFVEELAAFLAPEMEQANVRLEVVAEGAPRVSADADQLRQALLNLCRNAREAMPEGGRVRIAVAPAEGGAMVSISDQGTGIPEADRDKVFDLFYTTKEHGTGLGLSLTQEIVSAHRGRIRCEASEWGGTRFSIWLPGGKDDGTSPDHGIHAS